MTTTMGRIAAAMTPGLAEIPGLAEDRQAGKPQPEPDDDARYWLTARGLGELRTGSGLDARMAQGLLERDPDAIVGYFPEWEAWDRIR